MKDNCISLEEFWSLVIRLNQDAKRCSIALDDTAADDEEGKSFWRRMYARAVFALIDGATYRMMFHAYAARERPGVGFSAAELKRLEEAYDFDEDRAPVATFCRQQTLDDIRFAFEAFARVHSAAYVLPVHDSSWVLIKEIARIRQGLQFCRTVEEIEVYEENVETILYGLQFFVECMVELLESCADSMEAGATAGELVDHEIVM
jgi:hypothetical protein